MMARITIGEAADTFIVTQEHKRFAEFAHAVRQHRYIGLCHGPAGVGKTLSARRYARWDKTEDLLTHWGARSPSDAAVYALVAHARSVFYTPTVGATLRELRQDLPRLFARAHLCIQEHHAARACAVADSRQQVELLIVDEAERLSTMALDYLRDLFDRRGIGLILIGMSGIEKRLSRYPQLYSRIGFAHHYRPLTPQELAFVLTHRWRQLGLTLDQADFTDAQAVASIVRITGGNFRLVHRLFAQIERVLKINGLHAITEDVVETARSALVIGVI